MEENEDLNLEPEDGAQDQGDAFLAGLDDTAEAETPADQRDIPAQGQEPTPAQGGVEGDGEGADKAEDGTDDEPDADKEGEEGDQTPPAKEQTWEVNHLGQHKTMRSQDITPELLQKGLDYDRVRQQYDKAKPMLSLITTLAEKAGVSAEEYVRMARTEAKRAEGLDEDEAKRAVELEDREAAVSAKEAEEKAAATRKESDEAKIQQGIEEFAKAFPDVYAKARSDAAAIPDSVWADVSGGMSLTAAYSKYAVAQAQAAAKEAQERAKAAEQNQKNTQRATGSMKSSGSDTKSKDPFLEGWDS